MPLSSSVYAALDSETKVNVFRSFQTYNFFSLTFTLTINAVFITFFINKTLKPIRALTEGTKKVAHGDFNVEITADPDRRDELSALTESFNKMARELSFISMLTNDFINNVSHEFKTPISSIQGFATVLLGTDLTDEQREYAGIIAHESARLTRLTSNILKLTKLENQVIITGKETFFLDEQIRHSILLFQNEWTKKNIHMNIELSPLTYTGILNLYSK